MSNGAAPATATPTASNALAGAPPAPAAAASGAAAAPAAAPAGAAEPGVWWSGLTPESSTYIAGKGFKSLADLVGSYQLIEKRDRDGSRVTIPGDDAKPEDVSKFWSKLGLPEKPEGYTLPSDYKVPDGAVDLVPWFRQVAHEAGLPDKAFAKIVPAFTAEMERMAQAESEREDAAHAEKLDAVVKAWGPKAAENQRAMQLFCQVAQIDENTFETIARAVGPEVLAKIGTTIGNTLVEHKVGIDTSGAGSQYGMTKEAAQARLDELQSNPEFRAKLYASPPEKAAKNEWDRLTGTASGRIS